MPKPTEEQIIRILNTVARRYSKRSGGKFEVDELVNQVWLVGAVQQMPDVKMVWGRARYDMFHYMRTYSKWRHCGVKRGTDLREKRRTCEYPNCELDEQEQIDFLSEGLDRKGMLVFNLIVAGFDLYAISGIMGYSVAWTSLYVHRGIKGCSLHNHLKERYFLQKSE